MSRTRKGGKFKGGSFAKTFKTGLAMNSPFNVVVAGDATSPEAAAKAEQDKAQASLDDKAIVDTVDDKRQEKFSRGEIDAFMQRKKLAEEQEAAKQAAEEAEKAGEDEAPTEEEKAEAASTTGGDLNPDETKGGADQTYTDDYDGDMTKKEVKQEKKENKKEIRQAARDQKKDAKNTKKETKQELKDQLAAGEITKNEFRSTG